MTAAAIGVDEDGVGTVQCGVIVDAFAVDVAARPATGVDVDLQARDARQCLLHQHRPGAESVHAGRVARPPGDQHDTPRVRRPAGVGVWRRGWSGIRPAGERERQDDCNGEQREDTTGRRVSHGAPQRASIPVAGAPSSGLDGRDGSRRRVAGTSPGSIICRLIRTLRTPGPSTRGRRAEPGGVDMVRAMRMAVLTAAVIGAVVLPAFAEQNRPRVAVLNFENNSTWTYWGEHLGRAAADELVTQLLKD